MSLPIDVLDRIFCGDCLPYLQDMESKSIDLVLTDPPYGIGEAAGKNNSRGSAKNSNKWIGSKNTTGAGIPSTKFVTSEWDDAPPSPEVFAEIFRVSKNQIVFGGN